MKILNVKELFYSTVWYMQIIFLVADELIPKGFCI